VKDGSNFGWTGICPHSAIDQSREEWIIKMKGQVIQIFHMASDMKNFSCLRQKWNHKGIEKLGIVKLSTLLHMYFMEVLIPLSDCQIKH
jgi:hypothetical protein